MPTKYDKSVKQRALQLWAQSTPVEQIAAEVGVDRRQISRWARRDRLLNQNSTYIGYDRRLKAVDDKVAEAEKRGLCMAEIVKEYKLDRRSIANARDRLGLPPCPRRVPLTPDDIEDIKKMHSEKKSTQEIAEYVGCPRGTVRSCLVREKIKAQDAESLCLTVQEQRVKAMELWDRGFTIEKIVKIIGSTWATVLRWARQSGKAKPDQPVKCLTEQKHRINLCILEADKLGLNYTEIQEKYKISRLTAINARKRLGLPITRRKTKYKAKKEQYKNMSRHTQETKDLALSYWREGISTIEIQKKTGVDPSTIARWAREEGILDLNPAFRSTMERKKALELYVKQAHEQGLIGPGFYRKAYRETGSFYRTVHKAIQRLGIEPPRRTYTPLSKEEFKEALAMLERGDSTKAVAEYFGIVPASLRERVKREKSNAH